MIKGKNIVITGGSSGIGKALLEMLAAQENGNRIVAASRSIGKLSGFGDNVTLFPCDLSSQDGVDALFSKAEELFGKIDIFFCNAGAPYYERYDYEDWKRIEDIFSLNTFSYMYSYSKYLHHLDGREGRLVFTISAMGEMALPGYALYASTKFAMEGFRQAVKLDTPENLKLTCVYPVSTKTNFFEVGGAGHKVEQPFPVQSAEAVAKAMIRGVETGKRKIYPCPVYLPSRLLMTVVPPVREIYLRSQQRMLQRFLQRKAAEEDKND